MRTIYAVYDIDFVMLHFLGQTHRNDEMLTGSKNQVEEGTFCHMSEILRLIRAKAGYNACVIQGLISHLIMEPFRSVKSY